MKVGTGIRRADADDAAAIARVYVETWRSAYPGMLPDRVLIGMSVARQQAAWRHTLVGFALGMPLIYAMNLIRIAVLLVVGGYSQRWFDFMHLYFWQVTMIAMVAAAWLAWLWWVVRDETDPAAVS